MAFVLRDYQHTLAHRIRLSIRQGNRRILAVAPTGAGKTVVFSYIAKSGMEKGSKILILAHRDQLIKQASRKLSDYDLQHGIIMAGFTPNPMAGAQVGSVQTLVRRLAKLRFRPDIIIIDEAHLSAAPTYQKIIEHFAEAVVVGFTGSPCRLDNKPLGRVAGGVYDDLVMSTSVGDLIRRGFLVKPRVYASAKELDLSGVRKSGGDYNQKDLAAKVDRPKLVGDAVKMYQKICPGVPAVAWCVSIQHAEHVAAEFNAHGVRATMLCGDDPSDRRDAVMAALESGEIQVVTFVGILIEGVDCPAIQAIIMLRPTLSLSSYLQVIGRGLRTIYADGMPLDTDDQRLAAIEASHKQCCYVLDHAGLAFKHGLPDEEREWSLEEGEVKAPGKKKKPEERVDMVLCKSCYAVFPPPETNACPHCGAPLPVRQRKVEVEDGDLTEITPEMAERMRRDRKREVAQARTLEDLKKIGAQRGYKPGWADNVFNARRSRAG